MQSKKFSHYEVMSNQIVGILVGLVVVYHLMPIIKYMPPELQSPIVVFTMFVFSYSRTYLLRRLFNRLK